jgi:threonine synthase
MAPKSMMYSSTRGGQRSLDFRTVIMMGLAHDHGLFVPDYFPQVSSEELNTWQKLNFKQLALKVISKYVQDDQVPRDKLRDIVNRSCNAFALGMSHQWWKWEDMLCW